MSDERIARLEAHRENDMLAVDAVRADLSTIKREVAEINSKLDRQKGFIAGVLFILTPLWVAIVAFVKSAWAYVTDGSVS